MRELTTQILDDVLPLGECEAIEAIASRLPAMMIGEMLGYAPEEWEKVRYWSEQTMLLGGQTSPNGPPHFTSEEMSPVIHGLGGRHDEAHRRAAGASAGRPRSPSGPSRVGTSNTS